MEKIKVALVGAGNRGKNVYAKYIKVFSEQMELVAVADPDIEKVQEVKNEYNLSEDMCFASGEELLKHDRLADIIFLCTMDHQHYDLAVMAIKKGYHLLLEKPISPSLEECKALEELAVKEKRHVFVCHVLRYAPLYQELKKILNDGIIGDLLSIQASENIGYYHFSHSFVRGNWRNTAESNPMIMQKCCHDMDILLWLTDKHCKYISSFGSLTYFKPENAPKGCADRCYRCNLKDICVFNAEQIYVHSPVSGIANGIVEWASMFVVDPTPDKVLKALETNKYGRCVWRCDNDVADHQVVNLMMEDDIAISFHVCATTNSMGRTMHLCGTKGDIYTNTDTQTITIQLFGQEKKTIHVGELCQDLSGHGGGDRKLIEDTINVLNSKHNDVRFGLTEITRSIESHFMSFAAEESRLNNGKVIDMDIFNQKF